MPVLQIISLLIIIGGVCVSTVKYIHEKKILKRLKSIDQAKWQELIWLSETNAHPIRFRKFILNCETQDDELNEYIVKYRKALLFQLIVAAIFVLLLIVCILFRFIKLN